MTPAGQLTPPASEPDEEDIDASVIAPELVIPELDPLLLLLPVDDPLVVASAPLLPLTPESPLAAPELPVPEPLPDPLELEEEVDPPSGELGLVPQPESDDKPTRQRAHVAVKRFFILVPWSSG